jgi:predicted metalloendopeptidase
LLDSDPHSPGKARVNVTLSNFDKFAEAFQCGAESKMVAKPVCQIW